jgi:hypothetical protein
VTNLYWARQKLKGVRLERQIRTLKLSFLSLGDNYVSYGFCDKIATPAEKYYKNSDILSNFKEILCTSDLLIALSYMKPLPP